MPLNIPQLDDRSYQDLLDDALAHIHEDLNTDWNDLSAGDPGVVLLETFAFLTEQMLYRLNRLPEKAYIAFLRMLGVALQPPYAASVKLSFWQDPEGESTIRVPRGTRVASESKGVEPIVFTTTEDLDVPPDSLSPETAKTVIAYHAMWVEEDLAPLGDGSPGQVFTVKHPPILASAKGLKMRLGMEIPSIAWNKEDDWILRDPDTNSDSERHFQVWQEVQNFAGLAEDRQVYRVDRQAGIIRFAPAAYLYPDKTAKEANRQNGGLTHAESNGKKALAAVPPKGCTIHVRYPTGGGATGNIPAGVLTTIRDPENLKTQIKVTNKEPARGGVDTETLENVLVRGPQEIFTQERLITARDFERRVLRAWPDIAGARAYALQDLWEHAVPGTVSINLVPALRGPNYPTDDTITKEALESEQARLGEVKDRVEKELTAESPLGIRPRLKWARYKRVSVSVVATVPPEVETEPIRKLLQEMFYSTISPLPSKGRKTVGAEKQVSVQNGRSFGAELHLAEVSRLIFDSDKNITMLPTLELNIDRVPNKDITSLAVDYFQANTWYAASGQRLFRTTNNAAGWEELLDFSAGKSNPSLHLQDGMKSPSGGQSLKKVCPSPYRAGLLALSTLNEPAADSLRSIIYLSTDCGESWLQLTDMDAEIYDMDWLQRAGWHILLLATSNGLKELYIKLNREGEPRLKNSYPVLVMDPERLTLPVYAVKVLTGGGGATRVAVAMAGRRGVYLSKGIDLNLSNGTAFTPLTTDSTDDIPPDIRCLGVQWCEQENRYLLWAGSMAIGPKDYGDGCCRWIFSEELKGPLEENGHWFKEGWAGGSCLGLDFQGNRVLAATACGSILVADVKLRTEDTAQESLRWKTFTENDLPVKTRFDGLHPTAEEQAREKHIPFTAVASNDRLKNPQPPLVLTGCGEGIFRSQNHGETFEKTSRSIFRQLKDSVTIPPNWLLVSGPHDIKVVHEGEEDNNGSAAGGVAERRKKL